MPDDPVNPVTIEWVSDCTPKPEFDNFIYIPDIPAQMLEPDETT